MEKSNPAPTGEEILEALNAPIEPVRVQIVYKAGLFVVTLAMVLLPLIYFGLIAAVGWLTWQHAVRDTFLLTGHGRSSSLFLYLAPIVAGLCLILFMVKPIFAKQGKQPKRFRIDREREPLLFAFVEKVATSVGAPKPKEILVDCEVNASASFRKGMLSFLGNDLTLTIGLPLAAGLSLREMAGVLAHEFGHFSQGTGMRLTYVIRSVNFWFARVVYDRDVFDEKLIAWSKEGDFRIMAVLWVVRFFVWLTRRILWVLMMAGHAISCFALRQMEYDADRYEARLAGSDAFESTAGRLRELAMASQAAHADLGASWTEKRLGDDLAQLVVLRTGSLPRESLDAAQKAAREARTGFFDTHPADGDRIRNARAENAAGIFRVEGPVSAVFRDFDAVSREATLHFYRDVVGIDVKPENMVPTMELARRQAEADEAQRSLARYFQGCVTVMAPLPMPKDDAGQQSAESSSVEGLRAARERMEQRMAEAAPHVARIGSVLERLDRGLQAAALFKAEFTIKKNASGMATTAMQAESAVLQARADLKSDLLALGPFHSAARDRLWAAFGLLRSATETEMPRKAEQLSRLDRCLRALEAIESVRGETLKVREEFLALEVLAAQLSDREPSQAHVRAIRTRMVSIARPLKAIRTPLMATPYPFEHARQGVSMADYLVEQSPDEDNLQEVYAAGNAFLDRYFTLNVRLLGVLTMIAEEVERVSGLPRQASPPPRSDAQSCTATP